MVHRYLKRKSVVWKDILDLSMLLPSTLMAEGVQGLNFFLNTSIMDIGKKSSLQPMYDTQF